MWTPVENWAPFWGLLWKKWTAVYVRLTAVSAYPVAGVRVDSGFPETCQRKAASGKDPEALPSKNPSPDAAPQRPDSPNPLPGREFRDGIASEAADRDRELPPVPNGRRNSLYNMLHQIRQADSRRR